MLAVGIGKAARINEAFICPGKRGAKAVLLLAREAWVLNNFPQNSLMWMPPARLHVSHGRLKKSVLLLSPRRLLPRVFGLCALPAFSPRLLYTSNNDGGCQLGLYWLRWRFGTCGNCLSSTPFPVPVLRVDPWKVAGQRVKEDGLPRVGLAAELLVSPRGRDKGWGHCRGGRGRLRAGGGPRQDRLGGHFAGGNPTRPEARAHAC